MLERIAEQDNLNHKVAIEIKSVSKKYTKNFAVDNVSIEINQGDIVSLIGPNGAGKSTIINMLTGLIEPTNGKISLMGQELDSKNRDKICRIGVLLQDTQLFPRLTPREYLAFYHSLFDNPMDTNLIVQLLGLEDYLDVNVKDLSGGLRQRLALGLTLVNDPEVIVLDEPTVGLDPIIRRELWAIIRNLKKSGKTILFTTHYMDEAVSLSDKLVMLSLGKVIYSGAPETIKEFGKSLEGGLDEAFEKYASGVFSI